MRLLEDDVIVEDPVVEAKDKEKKKTFMTLNLMMMINRLTV